MSKPDFALSDLLVIRLVKELERDQPRYLDAGDSGDIDCDIDAVISARQHIKWDDEEQRVKLLAERADAILRAKYVFSKGQLQFAFKWGGRILWLALVPFGLLLGSWFVFQILGDASSPVDLGGYWTIFGVTIVLLSGAIVLLMVGLCLRRLQNHSDRVAFSLRWIWKKLVTFPANCRFALKSVFPRFGKETVERSTLEAVLPHLLPVMTENTGYLMLRLLRSCLFRLMCVYFLVVLSATAMAFRSRRDFFWGTTILNSRAQMLVLTKIVFDPLERTGLVPFPDMRHIAYVDLRKGSVAAALESRLKETEIDCRALITQGRELARDEDSGEIEILVANGLYLVQQSNKTLDKLRDLDRELPMLGPEGRVIIQDISASVSKLNNALRSLDGSGSRSGDLPRVRNDLGAVVLHWSRMVDWTSPNRQEMRSDWMWWIILSMFLYGALPWLLLWKAADRLSLYSRKDLWPYSNDEYYKAIVERWRTPPYDVSDDDEVPPPPNSPSTGTSPPETSQAPSPETPGAREQSIESRVGSDSRMRAAKGDAVAVQESVTYLIGFEVAAVEGGWTKALGLRWLSNQVDLGIADSSELRRQAIDQIKNAPRIGRIILVADMVDSPDSTWTDFLGALTQDVLEDGRGQVLVLLTGGERLRRRMGQDAQRIANRSSLWRRKCRECGVCEEHVLEYDHETPTAEAKNILSERLRGVIAGDRTDTSRESLHLAGKWTRASRMIVDAVRDNEMDQQTGEQLDESALDLRTKLHELYREEAGRFTRLCESLDIDESKVKVAVETVTKSASTQFKQLESTQFVQAYDAIVSYANKLRGPWATAAGLVALTAGGIISIPIFGTVGGALGGALVGGLTGMHLPWLLGRAVRGDEDAPERRSPTRASQDELGQFVRANVLWALILELQGNPTDQVARVLEQVLPVDDHASIQSGNDAERLVTNTGKRLTLFVRRSQVLKTQP